MERTQTQHNAYECVTQSEPSPILTPPPKQGNVILFIRLNLSDFFYLIADFNS